MAKSRRRTFFDISIDGRETGRIVFELYDDLGELLSVKICFKLSYEIFCFRWGALVLSDIPDFQVSLNTIVVFPFP